jgi:hypothetical protein
MRTARFNKIVVGELTVSFIDNPATITAKAAFVSGTTGFTHGYTTCRQ